MRWWHTLWQYVINVDKRDQAAPHLPHPLPHPAFWISCLHMLLLVGSTFTLISSPSGFHTIVFISKKVPIFKNYNKNVLSCLHRNFTERSRGRCVCRTAQSDIFIQSLSFPLSITRSKGLTNPQRDSLISDVNHGYWSGVPSLGPLKSLGW